MSQLRVQTAQRVSECVRLRRDARLHNTTTYNRRRSHRLVHNDQSDHPTPINKVSESVDHPGPRAEPSHLHHVLHSRYIQ